jgi:hypothetical protein
MISSLYLDGRARVVRVGLYGAALEVGGEGDIPALAPLAHLRRVCCWGRVQWAGEALIACASRAIPICFLGHGRGIGYFLPARPAAKCFGALIDDARLHPQWEERLRDWTDGELRRSLLTVTSDQSATSDAIKRLVAAGDTRLALRAGLKIAAPGQPWRPIWRHLNECLHAWTVEQLLGQPLALPDLGGSSDRPNLTNQMALVLSPLMIPAAHRQAATERARKSTTPPATTAGAGSLAHRCALAFKGVEPRLAKHFPRALRRFESLVRTCAEDFDLEAP